MAKKYNASILKVKDAEGKNVNIPAIKGEKGDSGVYVGSGEMPDGYNIQIDPDGTVTPPEYITPQMYGAVGDGETDDTQAFINALDSNSKVFVPKGEYVISSTLDLTKGKSLFGQSGNRGVLKFVGSTGNIIVLGEDSIFDNIDIHIPQKIDGNVFITDNRLVNTTVSFLHTVVENTTIQIDKVQSDASSEKLTLININASNVKKDEENYYQGLCYQTYKNINVVRPNWEGLDAQAVYTNGIKITLSADEPARTDLSWITHINFEDVFLGSPVTAIKCGRENNSGVDLSETTRIIEHILMTNVSAQVSAGYSKKFWDLEQCQIKAVNCIAWDYAEYVEGGKYGTMRKGARLSISPLEKSPVDNFEFPDDRRTPEARGHIHFLDTYFTLVKDGTEGGTSANDPRYARRLAAETSVYNYTDTTCPERLSNSIHKISGNAPTLKSLGFSDYQNINGMQLNDGGFLGNDGAHTTIFGITQDNHWVFRKYYSGDWFGDWHRIYSDVDDDLIKEKMTSLTDAGNYFTNKNVEDALQEIGAELLRIKELLE